MKVTDNRYSGYGRMGADLYKLLPPNTHKMSLTNGADFVRDMKKIFSKYSQTSLLSDVLSSNSSLFSIEPMNSLYSDFLVHAATVHESEPIGTYMFLLKIPERESGHNVDVLLTPISLYRLGGADQAFQPELFRFGQTWYSSSCGLQDMLPGLGELVGESSVHQSLVPVGPLVDNIGSTFINRLTTVTRGPCQPKDSREREGYVPLRVPSDALVELGSNQETTWAPRHLRTVIYVVITYVRSADTPALGIFFVKSSWAFQEVVAALKGYFSQLIINRLTRAGAVRDINTLTSAVICRLGFCSETCSQTQTTLQFRGTSLKTINFSDFTCDPDVWKIIL